MVANGPAIRLVSVTRRRVGVRPWVLSEGVLSKAQPQEGMARFLLIEESRLFRYESF